MPKKSFTLPNEIKVNGTRLEVHSIDCNYDGEITVEYTRAFVGQPESVELTFKTKEQYFERLAMCGGEVVDES